MATQYSSTDSAIKGLRDSVSAELATVSVKRFGAKGDGSTDDYAAITAAINYVSSKGGGVVLFPRGVYVVKTALTAVSNVTLMGSGASFQYIAGGASHTIIKGSGALAAVIRATSDVQNFGVDRLAIAGENGCVAGIDLSGAYWCHLQNLNFFGQAGRALRLGNGFNSRIRHVFGTNVGSALSSSTSYVGLIEIGGTDHLLSDIEISYNNGSTAPSAYSSGMYVAGLYVPGANNTIESNIVPEFCEVGVVITGDHNKVFGLRSDNSWGGGWIVNGNDNLFAACTGYENGKRSGTYDDWTINGAGNMFAACSSYTSTARLRYCFNDTVAQTSRVRNRYASCMGQNYTTAEFKGDGAVGSAFGKQETLGKITSVTSGTIDSTGFDTLLLEVSSQTITKITGGYLGKKLTILSGATHTLSDNNAVDGFYFGSGNVTTTANKGYNLVYNNGKWQAS